MGVPYEQNDTVQFNTQDWTPVLGVTHGLKSSASAGVTPTASTVSIIHSFPGTASVGLTGPGPFQHANALVVTASIGLTGPGNFTHTKGLSVSASLSLTGNSSPTLFLKHLGSIASVNLTFQGTVKLSRGFSVTATLGISSTSTLTIRPVSVSKNSILLFEATDSGSPSAFDAVVARDYSLVFADTTVSSYPKPYTLLN